MILFPAIDLIDGKCVRLSKGDYTSKIIYNEDPVEVAKEFEGAGIDHLHLVDLDGAKARKIINWNVLEKIATQTQLQIDFGGGVQSRNDIKIAFESGATQVNVGSLAARDHKTFLDWLQQYGSEKLILSADAKNRMIAVSGWEENTDLDVINYIKKYASEGVTYTTCTDIDKDGMLEGPSSDLYKEILDEVEGLQLIASGGVTTLKDIEDLQAIGLYGVIIGKAIYEGRIHLHDLKPFLC